MGVDIETYRGRIGTFRCSSGVDGVILYCTIHFSGCFKYIGSVAFIGILLLIAGIEQNPGPTDTGLKAKRELDNPLYKNWVRAATGLKYLKIGLQEFVDQQIIQQHHDLLYSYIKGTGHPATSCSSCTSENLMPAHPTRTCIQKFRGRCFCKDHHTRRLCPNNFCSRFYDLIVQNHAEANPLWANTDPTLWYANYFEFAKCFLGTTSYINKHLITDIDATGLLSIAINDLYIHDAITCMDNFEQCRETRNEIVHAKSLEVEDTQLECYIDKMIAVLQDKRYLCNSQSALVAIEKLEQLKKDQIHISSEDEEEIRRQSLAAISEMTERSLHDIDTKKQETLHGLDEHIQQSKSDIYTFSTAKKDEISENTDAALKTIKNICVEKKSEIQYQLATEVEEKKASLFKKINEHLEKKTAEKSSTTYAVSYEDNKKDLQQHLVKLYQKHYVMTSASPLITQENDINISDAYVSPNMVVAETDGTYRKINRYKQIFRSNGGRNRKVYIIGDAGTGKTSFCKMMMQNWCRAVMGKLEKTKSDKQIKHENDDNTNEIGTFDFLFYVPLNIMSLYSDDIHEMIKAQLKDYRALIEKVMSSESECCLILADGLDEWKPPENTGLCLQHLTYGIPRSDCVRNATLITTSRPSARGVLDIKSTQYDLKVTLLGVNEMSDFVKKYMALLLKSSSAVDDFQEKLLQTCTCIRPKQLQETPMLLQQIIFMYCKRHEIGQSVAHIYSNIVNIVFGWLEAKGWKRTAVNNSVKPQLLPKHFDKFDRCQEHRDLIIHLGKVAYIILVKEYNLSVVTGRRKLQEFGLTKEDISAVLKLGILKEEKCVDPSKVNFQISFVHTSYLEFFAAVYISSRCLPQTDTERVGTTQTSRIKHFILNKVSAAEILRLKNLLIMVCGLSPSHTESICDCIYQVAFKDKQLVKYRRDYKFIEKNRKIVKPIQDICFRCVSECKSNNDEQSLIKLCDLYLFCSSDEQMCFSCVAPLSVITFNHKGTNPSHKVCTSLSSFLSKTVSLEVLHLYNIRCDCKPDECYGYTIYLSGHKQLQSIVLRGSLHIFLYSGISPTSNLKLCEISNCSLTHAQCNLLSLFLSRAISLKCLILKKVQCSLPRCILRRVQCTHPDCVHKKVKCAQPEFVRNDINLSCNEQLQSLVFSDSDHIFLSIGCPTTNLKTCEIRDFFLTHEQCKSLSLSLSRAESLQSLNLNNIKCAQTDCDGHIIDLSHHRQLEKLVLDTSCHVSVFADNQTTTHLKSCTFEYCNLTHQQWIALTSFLSQAISVETLELCHLKCIQTKCDGHSINLSKHEHLESLTLLNCGKIYVSGVNMNLKSCEVINCTLSHQQWTSLTSFMSKAMSLEKLKLCSIKCMQVKCGGHSINLSCHKLLKKLELQKCDHIYVSGVNPKIEMKPCMISSCSLSHEQWTTVSEFISQAVSIVTLELRDIKCIEDKCSGHGINISCHQQLQTLLLCKCDQIHVSSVNHTSNLKSCRIFNCCLSHEQWISISKFLLHAVSLKFILFLNIKCTQVKCNGHAIDLSNHKQLKRVSLNGRLIGKSKQSLVFLPCVKGTISMCQSVCYCLCVALLFMSLMCMYMFMSSLS